MVAQEARAHHRRQRQRDERRDHHRDGDRHRELAEQPSDDAAHQQQRDEHRDQREADRHDGEADLAGALQRRLHRLHALLDVADRCSPASRSRRRPRSRPRWSAPSATGCRGCSSSRYITAKVQISATGTVIDGMMVAQTLRRNRKITITTRLIDSSRVNCTSCDRGADRLRAVHDHADMDRRRDRRPPAPAAPP